MTGIPIKSGNLDAEADMYREKMLRRFTEERQPGNRNDGSTSTGIPKIVGKHQKIEELGKDSPVQSLERTQPF
jgi:hypothetical protein